MGAQGLEHILFLVLFSSSVLKVCLQNYITFKYAVINYLNHIFIHNLIKTTGVQIENQVDKMETMTDIRQF